MNEIPKIPGYRMTSLIREGDTASSWMAVQLSLDRSVVIKMLHSDGSNEQKAQIAAIIANMRKAASLKHKNLVEVIDVGECESQSYIVLGFAEGASTVAEHLRVRLTIPEKEMLRIASDVADALNCAWEMRRLVHANVKPENIVILRDGMAMISDLGMARKETVLDIDSGIPMEMIIGTPHYMSPEQVRCSTNLDNRSDIYSLGATLYHMATGKLPFEGMDDNQVMEAQLTGQVADPRDINPAISKSASYIIEKMMMKDPDLRYQSWNEFLADIALTGKTKAQPQRVLQGTSTMKSLRETAPGIKKPATLRRRVTLAGAAAPATIRIAGREGAADGGRLMVAASRKTASNLQLAMFFIRWAAVVALWVYLGYTLLRLPPQ